MSGASSLPTEQDLLAEVAEQIRCCTLCPLHSGRNHAVPGEGPAGAPVAFIGEAPGAEEDRQGRPFVGRSGQLLRQTIREAGWREEDVFIGNVLKCRPPDNRDPQDDEIAACRHYLEAQLALIRPRLVVTLGRYSMALLIKPGLKITEVRGRLVTREGRLLLPTFHPAAVLRNPRLLADFRRDIFAALKHSKPA